MSSVASPFGLRAVIKAGGTPASLSVQGVIASGQATSIGEGDPVKLASGIIVRAAGLIGTDTVGILGTFMGVEYTDANGRRQESNQWVGGTVATNIVCYYTDDPFITYEIQANGPVTQAMVGGECDMTTTTLNTTTGLSNVALDTVGQFSQSGAVKLLRIVGFSPGPDNVVGDAFTIVRVQISKPMYAFGVNGIA
jgi:hypothetical protein